MQYRSLARSILDEAGRVAPAVADDRLLGRLLDGVLGRLRRNPLATLVRERPGAARGVLRTLSDLREAGIELAHPDSLAEVARAYRRALASRRGAGLADDTALLEEATPFAGSFASRRAAILHHGAYDLVGIHLDLMRALDRGRECVMLLPVAEGSPATAYAESFARRFLLAPGTGFEPPRVSDGGLVGDRLRALYDESASVPALPEGSVACFHALGAEAETEAALRLALGEAAGGLDPAEVVVLARSLAPYGPSLDATLPAGDLFDAAIARPLRALPEVRDFVLALRAAVEDFPRATTAEALASPLLRWDDAPDFPGARAEAWSRKAAVTGTLAGWRERIVSWAAEERRRDDASDDEIEAERRRTEGRLASARRIAGALEAFARELDAATPRTWSALARHLEALARSRIVAEEAAPEVVERLAEAIRSLARFESILGETDRIAFPTALAALEAELDAAPPPASSSKGAVPVLDAMQARGMTFERVIVMGLHTGLFPQSPREDPFLGDDLRQALRESTGRPLAVKRDADSEERQLLVSMLGAAKSGLRLSWQRADDRGATKAPSLALREVARAVFGEADLDAVRRIARCLPAHPQHRIETLAAWTGLLRPDEALVLAALASDGGDRAAAALASREPALACGLELLSATESFAPREMAYDGRVSREALPSAGFSATAFGTLGRCPLQYFFRFALGVRPLEEESSPFEEEARRVGQAVHALLEGLYRLLDEEGLFEEDTATLLARARACLRDLWKGAAASLSRSPLAVWREVHDAKWLAAVETFVAADLTRLAANGLRPLALERLARASIPLRGGPVEVHGRFDRILSGGDGIVVGDYKSSGRLDKHVNLTAMLRGQALQVPLYRELAAATSGGPSPVTVEVLGVGPDNGAEREAFAGFPDDAMREGFAETLATLRGLAASGTFPIHVDPDNVCNWCDYARACRRTQVPTQRRNDVSHDGADYRDTLRKSQKHPRLSEVRATRSPGEEP